ncbi:SRPBCC domain-containing protein [Methanobacterium alcaliphilum]|nr:SRPBCC domain-containing protein [Methanobacterium alcaliphilum]
MLDRDTYEIWTEPFSPGSTFEGDWSEGSKIVFMSPDENGKIFGMLSLIKENRPYEFISIENRGLVKEGKEITTGEEAEKYVGSLENYTFKDIGNKTKLIVDLTGPGEIDEDMKQYFNDIWQKALEKLKEIAEE